MESPAIGCSILSRCLVLRMVLQMVSEMVLSLELRMA